METPLGYVKHFKDLEVYRRQRELRRAARSVGAQIAEAWAKRRYPKHFVSKLTDADAEQLETQYWIMEATTCGYLAAVDSQRLLSLCKSAAC